ncbi:MAG: ion transporter [Bacteroidales bacterium]|nr:ion transporter [Clostridium sp.]MCM1205021.1 ion transporter [Bacteroidales bacterium]
MKQLISEKRKRRIFDIIQIGKKEDFASRAFDLFIVLVIFINIAVLFIETFDEAEKYSAALHLAELVTVVIFGIEYLLRIWTAEYLYPEKTRGKAILRFLVSFDGIVDLCTILPFFFLSGFIALRMLRVVRIFHLFRINAYYDSFNVITSVLVEKKNQIISSIFIILILMLSSSLCMYSAEHEAQPDVFENAFSGIWWSMSTILTVGYGDIYPVTILGRMMAIIISFLGVGVVAIPTGIISAGFVEQYTQLQNQNNTGGNVRGTVSVTVDEKSPFAGQTVKAVETKYQIDIVAFIRSAAVIVPVDSIKIMTGDVLIYQTLGNGEKPKTNSRKRKK